MDRPISTAWSRRKQAATKRNLEGEMASGENRHDKVRVYVVGRGGPLFFFGICVIWSWSSHLLGDFSFAGMSGKQLDLKLNNG